MKVLSESDYTTSSWSGGETTQVLLYPPNASFKDRTFLFRISFATVEQEESTFTNFSNYNRVILSIDGKLALSHNGGEKILLSEFEPHCFDGDFATKSFGKVTDFNLMVAKGNKGEITIVDKALKVNGDSSANVFYISGQTDADIQGKKFTIKNHQTLVLDKFENVIFTNLKPNTKIIRCCILLK